MIPIAIITITQIIYFVSPGKDVTKKKRLLLKNETEENKNYLINYTK